MSARAAFGAPPIDTLEPGRLALGKGALCLLSGLRRAPPAGSFWPALAEPEIPAPGHWLTGAST